jgi:transposase
MKAKVAVTRRFPGLERSRRQRPIRPAASLPVIHAHAAGIDVGAVEHWACVPEDSVPASQPNVRPFRAFNSDLDQLVEWFVACRIRTVAVEATGVYWIGLAQKLEAAGIELVLVNARHVRNVPGRKSDVRDCQWLQQLHSYGLLQGSFRPTQDICRLRSLTRHRQNLVASCGREVQHMQKALQQMNVHLHHAVSDLVGETGLRIVDAILAGQRDPKQLVQLRDEQCRKTSSAELEKALQGDWRPEHLFVLGQGLETYRHYLKQVAQCDEQIQEALAQVVVAPPPVEPEWVVPPNPVAQVQDKPRKKRFQARKAGTGLKRDLTEELKRICGVDLTQIVGLNVLSVLIILSEIGLDMSRWDSAKAFCCWLGLCPRNKISGGKVLDSRTAHVVNRVAILLRTLAPSIGKTDTWLGIFHRRMRARLGPGGANTATARKLACLIYHLLRYQEDYITVNHTILLAKIKRQRLTRLQKQAEELGFQLIEKQEAA